VIATPELECASVGKLGKGWGRAAHAQSKDGTVTTDVAKAICEIGGQTFVSNFRVWTRPALFMSQGKIQFRHRQVD